LYLFTPDIKDALTGTASNGELSGGFGPNQVATALGLGMFIFFTRLIFSSRSKIIFLINLALALYISYRGMLTFSRGGMITGFVMIIILLLVIYINSKNTSKIKLNYLIAFLLITMLSIWTFTSYQTGGFIDKRYANQDALGRTKSDRFTGRGEIAEEEVEMFLGSPFFGVGTAKGTEIRTQRRGMIENFASHNEITRMLAEHGLLGIVALFILFITPLFLYYENRQNIFLLCFVTFWLLTINHAAMRTASPCFIYALSLLKVRFDEEDTLHR
jgi:O-antigen ligase